MNEDFDGFATAVQRDLHNLALALTGGEVHEAKDLVQSALERIWARWSKLEMTDGKAYARKVLVNEFSSVRRRARWRRERIGLDDIRHAVEDDFSDGVDASAALFHALRQLPRRQREVVALRYLEDLSVAEVADMLGCSTGTVKRSSHDGLASLRNTFSAPAERA